MYCLNSSSLMFSNSSTRLLARASPNRQPVLLAICAWSLELLKEIAPGVTRVAVLRDAALPSGTGQFSAIQSVAPSFGVDVSPINVRDTGEIEHSVSAFARSGYGGLIVAAGPVVSVHRD